MNNLIITVVFNQTKLTTTLRTNSFNDSQDLTQEESLKNLLLILYDDQERCLDVRSRDAIIRAINQYTEDPSSNTISIEAHLELVKVNDSNPDFDIFDIISSARKSADYTALQDLLTDFFEDRPNLNGEDIKLLLNKFLESW